MRKPVAVVSFLLASFAGAAFAQLSPQYANFADTAAKWLMTPAEQKAWSAVSTDEQARDFIDLFWARRDPTPGTFRNEFRDEFNDRVAYADRTFRDQKVAGSLTDRGRVYILLGAPTNWLHVGSEQSKAPVTDGQGIGQQRLGGRDEWLYEGEAARRNGMPRIQVIFIEDLATLQWHRDVQRSEAMMGMMAAAKKAVVSPELNSVPDWAREPITLKIVDTPALHKLNAPKLLPKGETGAHHFVLAKSSDAVGQPQGARDPFANVAESNSFTKSDDLNYAFEYCVDKYDADNPPSLTVALAITGTTSAAHPERINMKGAAEEVQPEAIKVIPGCYVVRAAIPMSDMEPGTYTITVQLTDAATKQTYNLTREFKVE